MLHDCLVLRMLLIYFVISTENTICSCFITTLVHHISLAPWNMYRLRWTASGLWITVKNLTNDAPSCNSYTTPSPSGFIPDLILQSRIFSIDDVTDEVPPEYCRDVRRVCRPFGAAVYFHFTWFFLTKRGNAVTEVKYLRARISSIFATLKKLFK